MEGVSIMIKVSLNEFMSIASMVMSTIENFEHMEKKDIDPATSEIVIYDKDFKGERKIDIGLLAV